MVIGGITQLVSHHSTCVASLNLCRSTQLVSYVPESTVEIYVSSVDVSVLSTCPLKCPCYRACPLTYPCYR